jgi:aspartate racemase
MIKKPVLLFFKCLVSIVITLGLSTSATCEQSVVPETLIGIFGGMGPEATANLYQEIIKSTPAKKDQDHLPTLIYSLPQIPDRTEAIKNNDRTLVPYLVEGVTRLEKAGASFIVIPCNTVHYFYEDMQKAVKIPIIHMIRETVKAVMDRFPTIKRIGLLATSGTIASGLYEAAFTDKNMTVLHPDEDVQTQSVMKAVYSIKSGGNKRESEELLFLAGKHLEKKGAQLIVLGCTEIPLAFNPERASIPVINATRVLAESTVREFQKRAGLHAH